MRYIKSTTALSLTALCTAALLAFFILSKEDTQGVGGLSEQDQYALEVGRKVISIQAALEHPEQLASVKAVKALGLDSRHYAMVRGWLLQELQPAESWKETSTYNTSQDYKDITDQRITALRSMIRAIDLE
ncbi:MULTISPECIES: hypothetical protein [unclassified Halomonas]|uniref:hypothetical protein n=1 Tax=unclassified Halomonas TaxID=2609666 RepID=UPI0009909DC8|nr:MULTISPECIES: hypothetical protein [unclassified Halomonas]AQU83528.1 hypothetical protein B2G49_13695 [Halomonas sp. 'Soap Lake \